jgi:hypothetical protein
MLKYVAHVKLLAAQYNNLLADWLHPEIMPLICTVTTVAPSSTYELVRMLEVLSTLN